MAGDLKSFFEEQLIPEANADEYTRALGIQCATGVLLIQVAKADSQQDEIERAMVVAILQETFDLLDETVEDILQLADGATAEDISQLIKLVNDHYGYNDKEKLIDEHYAKTCEHDVYFAPCTYIVADRHSDEPYFRVFKYAHKGII